jgi:response regulator of citrate/malate metabolism
VEQSELDKLFGSSPGRPAPPKLPKGLSPESADLVAGVLRTCARTTSRRRSAPNAPASPG